MRGHFLLPVQDDDFFNYKPWLGCTFLHRTGTEIMNIFMLMVIFITVMLIDLKKTAQIIPGKTGDDRSLQAVMFSPLLKDFAIARC